MLVAWPNPAFLAAAKINAQIESRKWMNIATFIALHKPDHESNAEEQG